YTDPDYPAAQLAAFIAGGTSNARLWKRLREQDGLSYDVSAWLEASPFEAGGAFGALAIMAPQNEPKAKKAMPAERRGLAQDGVTDDELAKAKKAWLEQATAALADDAALTGVLGDLLEEDRDFSWLVDERAAVAALTAAKVSAAAKSAIDPDRLIVVEVGSLK